MQHQSAVRPEELPDLLRAIAKYDETGDKQTRLALQLLAQTFVRTNELIGAVELTPFRGHFNGHFYKSRLIVAVRLLNFVF